MFVAGTWVTFGAQTSDEVSKPFSIHTLEGITLGGVLYLYKLRNPTIMHWAGTWHMLHEDFMVLVSCIVGQLMDKWGIQILILVSLTPFNYIQFNINLTNNPYTCKEKRSVLKGLSIYILQCTVNISPFSRDS